MDQEAPLTYVEEKQESIEDTRRYVGHCLYNLRSAITCALHLLSHAD